MGHVGMPSNQARDQFGYRPLVIVVAMILLTALVAQFCTSRESDKPANADQQAVDGHSYESAKSFFLGKLNLNEELQAYSEFVEMPPRQAKVMSGNEDIGKRIASFESRLGKDVAVTRYIYVEMRTSEGVVNSTWQGFYKGENDKKWRVMFPEFNQW